MTSHELPRTCRPAGRFRLLFLALALASGLAVACTPSTSPEPREPAKQPAKPSVRPRSKRPVKRPARPAKQTRCRDIATTERGKGVWYGGKHHGRPTASGERFNKNAMTAAHKTLPLGTRVRVTNLANHRSVDVRINDRGPYSKGRIIDVSEAAARKLDMIQAGVVPVEVRVLDLPPGKSARCP